ncbi:hypothetical protein DCC39_10900 [Pueribacillus theae]|uniref:Glyoxalase-like domain-containing protein n=1 Tax=Pueribacillus theae TaxID=2171751 RepID=A0A2U1K0Y5_9BACI|nr:VOC family protein [Pueribacillus theae]PWA10668.1 hypothetical protein DCC39_10900 [Pueribacillus theae]
MGFKFDHLVHFVEKPKKVIKELEKRGIHAVEGGKHQNHGTYNALCYFDLSYIEFLGTYDRELIKQTKHPRHSMRETIVKNKFKEGFVRFAVRTTDIEGVAARFREKGLTVNGPVPLSRQRPDGSVIEWRLLYAGDENGALELPFIIQWNESDEERRTDLIERQTIVSHPSKATFSHLSLAVNDLEQTVSKWSHLLDLNEGKAFIDKDLQAKCQTLELPGGNLVFCTPNGEGVVSEVLKRQGESIFQANFSGNTNETFELFGGVYKVN